METLVDFDFVQQRPELKTEAKFSTELNNDPDDKRLREQCHEFEAVLYESMLKSMRNTVEKSELFSGGKAEEIYTSMLDQEYAKILAGNTGASLADELYKQMIRVQPPEKGDLQTEI